MERPCSTTDRRKRTRGRGGAPSADARTVTTCGPAPSAVADAVAEYFTAHERHGGKAIYRARRVAETHLPFLRLAPHWSPS
jgi:hypothetical protein